MDFSVDLLHTMEKEINSEIVKVMKATNVSSVSDLSSTVLSNKLNKGQLSNFLCNIVKLLDSSMSLCKAAAGSVDAMKSKVVDTQNQLIEMQKEEIGAVKNTVKTEFKNWADVVKNNVTQDRKLTAKSVKEAVKAVNEEEERLKNLIIYGVKEAEGDCEETLQFGPLPNLVKSISKQTECPDCDVKNVYRIGNKTPGKVRPVKVEFQSSNDVASLLKNAPKLKSNEEFKTVYLAPDRSLEQRVARSKLVGQMKELNSLSIHNSTIEVNIFYQGQQN